MGKYSKAKEIYEQNNAFKQEQEALHKKHSHVDENTVILEKSGVPKATVSFLQSLGRVLIAIVLIGFATIGIITMVYPQIREAFFELIVNTVNEILNMNG